MGINTITSQSSGKIESSHLNEYFTALTGDLVPRSSGAATHQAGDLGSYTYRFLRAYAKDILLGTPGNNSKIEDDGDSTFDLGANEYSIYRNNSKYETISRLRRGLLFSASAPPGAIKISSGSGGTVTNSTWTTFESLTIETLGKGILIGLRRSTQTGYFSIQRTSTNESIIGEIRIRRGTTTIYQTQVRFDALPRSTGLELLLLEVPGGSIWKTDNPSAGTYTYSIQGRVTTADTELDQQDLNFFAFER